MCYYNFPESIPLVCRSLMLLFSTPTFRRAKRSTAACNTTKPLFNSHFRSGGLKGTVAFHRCFQLHAMGLDIEEYPLWSVLVPLSIPIWRAKRCNTFLTILSIMLLEAVQNALHLLETKCSALILKGTACTHFTQYNYGPFLFPHHLSLPLSFLKFIHHISTFTNLLLHS